MIYKFKSAATGDLIMLGPHGDALLGLLGREPAARGIIEPAAMQGAIGRLQAAIAEADAAPADSEEDGAKHESPVALRQRLWPMIQMLERARAAEVPIVWGV